MQRNSLLLVLALAWPAPLAAQDPASESGRLEELERQIEEGEDRLEQREAEVARIVHEMEAMRRRAVEITSEVQALEARLLTAETRVAVLQAQEDEDLAEFERRRVALVDILAALQSLERNKPPALLVQPGDAVDAARSAMLLGAVLPELEAQARGLRQRLDNLQQLQDTLQTERETLASTAEALAVEEAGLDRLMADRGNLAQELEQSIEEERTQLATYAAEAESLRELINRLTRQFSAALPTARPTPGRSPTRPAAPAPLFTNARGNLRMPAIGRVLEGFGETLEPGTHAQGVSVATRPAARVVAPFDSEIVFAAAYRGYGQLLILDPGDGYLILISGLARIDGVVGQQLLTGEPIGIMGRETLAPNMRRWSTDEEAGGQPVLYLEMREDGDPIDPLPWFREDQWRVDGT